jgi:hypothetical protein
MIDTKLNYSIGPNAQFHATKVSIFMNVGELEVKLFWFLLSKEKIFFRSFPKKKKLSKIDSPKKLFSTSCVYFEREMKFTYPLSNEP